VTEEAKDAKGLEEIVIKINYAEGIKTVRLYDGRIMDIDDDRDENDEDEESEGKSVF